MFSPMDIEHEVKQRLAHVPNVNIRSVHETYRTVMFDKLAGVRSQIQSLLTDLEKNNAHHPEQGWIMVSREEREAFKSRLRDLESELQP